MSDINIVFTTIQGLHTRLNYPKENALTYEDFNEKEIVLILTKDDITQAVCDNINKKMKLDESGNGILFVQKVNKAYGIY